MSDPRRLRKEREERKKVERILDESLKDLREGNVISGDDAIAAARGYLNREHNGHQG